MWCYSTIFQAVWVAIDLLAKGMHLVDSFFFFQNGVFNVYTDMVPHRLLSFGLCEIESDNKILEASSLSSCLLEGWLASLASAMSDLSFIESLSFIFCTF